MDSLLSIESDNSDEANEGVSVCVKAAGRFKKSKVGGCIYVVGFDGRPAHYQR